MLSASLMPKSVQEAEELIRSTFGEMAQQSKIKEIAANLRLENMVMDEVGSMDDVFFWFSPKFTML